jgi:Cdc6-like AAA superfamily ATPase
MCCGLGPSKRPPNPLHPAALPPMLLHAWRHCTAFTLLQSMTRRQHATTVRHRGENTKGKTQTKTKTKKNTNEDQNTRNMWCSCAHIRCNQIRTGCQVYHTSASRANLFCGTTWAAYAWHTYAASCSTRKTRKYQHPQPEVKTGGAPTPCGTMAQPSGAPSTTGRPLSHDARTYSCLPHLPCSFCALASGSVAVCDTVDK